MHISDRHAMHFINGHAGTSPNGLTVAICRDVLGYYKVTHDLTQVTCKNCVRLLKAANRYCKAKASGSAGMEPILKRWFVRLGHRIR